MIVSGGREPAAPYSWMLFVDGENLTLRAQEVARKRDVPLSSGRHYEKDVFVWFPSHGARQHFGGPEGRELRPSALRAYYYTSAVGDDNELNRIRRGLRGLGFDPQVFKKDARQNKTKGIDITLTKDMLGGAFMGHYDAAVLVAGDGDYLPLIHEVKRLGKLVYGPSSRMRGCTETFGSCAITSGRLKRSSMEAGGPR